MRRLSLTAALVVLGALAPAGSARACSCAPLPPAEALREADAAIVGRLVEVVPRGRYQADYRYWVRRAYRAGGEIAAGEVIAVRSARRAAACALPRRLGRWYGLFLVREGKRWASSMCGLIAPRKLRMAAAQSGRGERRREAGPAGCAP